MKTPEEQDQEDRSLIAEGVKLLRELGASRAQNSQTPNSNTQGNSTGSGTGDGAGELNNDAPERERRQREAQQQQEHPKRKSALRELLGG